MKRVTFEIDEALLVRAERLAAARGVSVGVMVAELLAREADAESAAAAEARREMGEMARRPDIPRRMIPWTREELYERGVSGYERDPLRGGENAAALVSGSAFGVSAQVLAEFVSAGRRKLRPALTEEVIGWWLTRLERQDPLPIDAGIVSRGRAISAETRPQLLRWRDPRGRRAPRLRRGPERRHDRRPRLRRRGGPQSVRAGMTMAFRRVALSIVAGLALAAPAADRKSVV